MDRGAWQATVYGFTKVSHDLATKQPPLSFIFSFAILIIVCLGASLVAQLVKNPPAMWEIWV